MAKYYAFLRGMNVGGRRVKNPELVTIFKNLGYQNCAAFLASGNVVFETPKPYAGLRTTIEKSLRVGLGYEVAVFLRSAAEAQAVATSAMFSEEELEATAGKSQVVFLHDTTENPQVLAELNLGEDKVRQKGRELYWLPTEGISTSKLDLDLLTKTFGNTTTRTARTISRMVAKFGAE